MTRYELESGDGHFVVDVTPAGEGYTATVSGKEYRLKLKRQPGQNTILVEVGDKPVTVTLLEANPQQVRMAIDGEHFSYTRAAPLVTASAPRAAAAATLKDVVVAPMPGRVTTTLVKDGERVSAGDPLVVLESMKMEVAVRADRDAEVKEVLVAEGAAVKRGQGLIRLG
ncbi:MAG: acetyl-CoA carboxylase biotin carboxyl carrier protein subunit [Thaumarchaeota archaeon]|nr:acetyl-CoA carboxylase biotin carboxyl carrier protein subunit [Nitrososphaerota archaeon]